MVLHYLKHHKLLTFRCLDSENKFNHFLIINRTQVINFKKHSFKKKYFSNNAGTKPNTLGLASS